uniref:Uncharacterized protein n=1 Tax=Triticum urartu TaxID=4572 RepID=A0A8R7P385_TRIUA
MTSKKSNRPTVTSCTALHMEWDRISCPICMEQPHNAVLLICSSYKNGCRSYICNTSHRHSNCLDRFREMNGDSKRISIRLDSCWRSQKVSGREVEVLLP